MAANDFKAIVARIMADVDVKDALAVLEERGLPAEYTDAAAQRLHDEANELAAKAAQLKLAEAPRAARQEVRDAIARVLNARAVLYRLRPTQPGDVAVGVPAVGGSE